MCMGGSADFTLPTLIAGGSGIVTGLGNFAPKACVKVFELWAEGKLEEVRTERETLWCSILSRS